MVFAAWILLHGAGAGQERMCQTWSLGTDSRAEKVTFRVEETIVQTNIMGRICVSAGKGQKSSPGSQC